MLVKIIRKSEISLQEKKKFYLFIQNALLPELQASEATGSSAPQEKGSSAFLRVCPESLMRR